MSRRAARSSRGHRLGRALAVAGGVAMLFPLYLVFVFATHTDQEILSSPAPLWFGSALGHNVADLLVRLPTFWQNLWMSVRTAAATALLQLLLCSLAGYAFALQQFRGKDVLFALTLSTLLLPGFLGMIPHRLLIGWLGWHDTARGLVVPAAASALGIFLMRQYIARAVSRELIEAARLDGCSTTGVYARIVLPLVAPALAALFLVAFIGAWNDLARQLMTLHDMPVYTAPMALYSMVGTGRVPLGALFAGTALSLVPVLLVFALCARSLFRNLVVDSSGAGI
jgi:multiple sugar transport system permease protein